MAEKLLCVIILLAMLAALTACGRSPAPESNAEYYSDAGVKADDYYDIPTEQGGI